jgi:hypothetical protein
MMTEPEMIELGRSYLCSAAADLKNMHGIELNPDLSDSSCLRVGQGMAEAQIRGIKQAQLDAERAQNEWEEMDDVDRRYILAKRDYDRKYGIDNAGY